MVFCSVNVSRTKQDSEDGHDDGNDKCGVTTLANCLASTRGYRVVANGDRFKLKSDVGNGAEYSDDGY